MQVHKIENALTENISHIRILLSSAKSDCLTKLLMISPLLQIITFFSFLYYLFISKVVGKILGMNLSIVIDNNTKFY